MSELSPYIEAIRRNRAMLSAEIVAAGGIVKHSGVHCWHGDKTASGGIYAADDGVLRFKCHGCKFLGDVFDVRAHRTGRARMDLIREEDLTSATRTLPPRPPAAIDWRAIAVNAYKALGDERRTELGKSLSLSHNALDRLGVGWLTAAELSGLKTNAEGNEGAYTFPQRDGDSKFVGMRLRFPDGKKKSITGSDGSGLFIPRTKDTGPLLIAEGPTDCAALIDMGYSVIGLPNNASGHAYAIAYIRANPRDVVIVYQNDTKGPAATVTPEKAQELAKALSSIAPSVRLMRVPGPHKDVRDWLKAGATCDDVDAAIDAADTMSATARLRARYAAIDDGSFYSVRYPFDYLTRGTQPNTPGSITVLAGDPGSTKSFLVLQVLAFWLGMGTRADVMMLEKDQEFHVDRALAQKSGVAQVTDLDWKRNNPAERDYLITEHRAFIDAMGKHIHTPSGGCKLSDVQAWIEQMAKDGSRIVIVDPITLADAGKDRWLEDSTFMREVGKILTKYGSSLILTTHPPKKSQGPVSMDHIAGGSAYARAADCVLYLVRYDEPKVVTIKARPNDGDVRAMFPSMHQETIDREIVILKAREGRGAGWRIGFAFNSESLTFFERGPIIKEKKHSQESEVA